MDMRPNNGPLPSTAGNDPMGSPFLGPMTPAPIDWGNIPAQVGMTSGEGVILTPQGPINDLMSLRSKYPFLPVLPFPAIIRPLFLAAGVARDLRLPDAASIMTMKGNLDFYICRNGAAAVPTAANTADTNGDNGNQSFLAPSGFLWYVGGMKQFSLIAAADTIVSVACWVPDQFPTV